MTLHSKLPRAFSLLSGGPLGVRTAVDRVAFFTWGYRIPEYVGQEFLLIPCEESTMPLFLNNFNFWLVKQEIPREIMRIAQIRPAQGSLAAHA
jgi:hypothetical protein